MAQLNLESDVAKAAVRALAVLIGEYNKTLKDEAVPAPVVERLVIDFGTKSHDEIFRAVADDVKCAKVDVDSPPPAEKFVGGVTEFRNTMKRAGFSDAFADEIAKQFVSKSIQSILSGKL